jgi:N-acetylmuramoyl-L-alanine amidase
MKIAGHRLSDAPFKQATSFGGEMTPTLVVVHDTAGRVEKGSSVSWFTSPDCNTSAHVVIERDGSITQLVPFNRKAWHAGASEWNGRSGCNNFSIGIEIVNPGKLDKDGRAWFHKKTESGFTGIKRAKTAAHGDGWWLDYTPEQLAAVTALCKELVARYPSITDIVAHWQVSPNRKIDTGPLFPLDTLREEVFTVDGIEPEIAFVQPEIVKPVASTVQGSRTIFGALAAFGASVAGFFKDAIEVVLEAAKEMEILAPASKVASALGLTVANVTFSIAIVALGLVLYARIDDAAKGKNPR